MSPSHRTVISLRKDVQSVINFIAFWEQICSSAACAVLIEEALIARGWDVPKGRKPTRKQWAEAPPQPEIQPLPRQNNDHRNNRLGDSVNRPASHLSALAGGVKAAAQAETSSLHAARLGAHISRDSGAAPDLNNDSEAVRELARAVQLLIRHQYRGNR